MEMFAWIKLRCRQAFLVRDVKRMGMFELRWHDALQGLRSVRRRGGPEKPIKRNSQAFPVYFFEGPVFGERVRLLIRYVVMYFCSASIPLRNNLNSTLSWRFKKT